MLLIAFFTDRYQAGTIASQPDWCFDNLWLLGCAGDLIGGQVMELTATIPNVFYFGVVAQGLIWLRARPRRAAAA